MCSICHSNAMYVKVEHSLIYFVFIIFCYLPLWKSILLPNTFFLLYLCKYCFYSYDTKGGVNTKGFFLSTSLFDST